MSDGHDALEQTLRRVLWALRPYLPDLIVIGGWVPHLYRRYGGFTDWKSRLSGTAEVDVLARPVPIIKALGDSPGLPSASTNQGRCVSTRVPAPSPMA